VDLSVKLADWTDWDAAEFWIGCALGVFSGSEEPLHIKHVFWSDNPLGNALHEVLVQLSTAGVLERRDEPDDQFRWRSGYPP
jgi:hypothetical protein